MRPPKTKYFSEGNISGLLEWAWVFGVKASSGVINFLVAAVAIHCLGTSASSNYFLTHAVFAILVQAVRLGRDDLIMGASAHAVTFKQFVFAVRPLVAAPLGMAVAVTVLCASVNSGSLGGGDYWPVLLPFSLAICPHIVLIWIGEFFKGQGRPSTGVILAFALPGIVLLVAIACGGVTRPEHLGWYFCIGQFIATAVGVLFACSLPVSTLRASAHRRDQSGSSLLATADFLDIAGRHLGVVVSGLLPIPGGPAIYRLTQRAGAVVLMAGSALQAIIGPDIARTDNCRAAGRAFRASKLVMSIALPLTIMLVAAAPYVMSLISDDLVGQELSVAIALIGASCAAASLPLRTYLIVHGHYWQLLVGNGVSLVMFGLGGLAMLFWVFGLPVVIAMYAVAQGVRLVIFVRYVGVHAGE